MRARNSALRVARPCTSNPFAVANVICFTLNPSPLCPALRPRRGKLVQCFLNRAHKALRIRRSDWEIEAVVESQLSATPQSTGGTAPCTLYLDRQEEDFTKKAAAQFI